MRHRCRSCSSCRVLFARGTRPKCCLPDHSEMGLPYFFPVPFLVPTFGHGYILRLIFMCSRLQLGAGTRSDSLFINKRRLLMAGHAKALAGAKRLSGSERPSFRGGPCV